VVVPRVAVITRIAMDHMEYLGNDLLRIAAEKLGIVKQQVPLVMADPSHPAIQALAEARCKEHGSVCTFIADNNASGCVFGADGASFTWEKTRFHIRLIGRYQPVNAVLALSALKAAGFGDYRAIAEGFEKAWLPGRFQVIAVRDKLAVFDVGHNPDAAHVFCQSLQERFPGKPVCCILGIMKDKDIAGMVPHYARLAQRILCTAPATERAARPEQIKKHIPDTFKGVCEVAATVASAVEAAFTTPEQIVCVAGSFFTVGEAMVSLNINPYI
jgi:dihydrofolate synthase / folylpolyglutamate synthase